MCYPSDISWNMNVCQQFSYHLIIVTHHFQFSLLTFLFCSVLLAHMVISTFLMGCQSPHSQILNSPCLMLQSRKKTSRPQFQWIPMDSINSIDSIPLFLLVEPHQFLILQPPRLNGCPRLFTGGSKSRNRSKIRRNGYPAESGGFSNSKKGCFNHQKVMKWWIFWRKSASLWVF